MTQAEQIYNKHECARYDKSTGEFRPNYEAILSAIQEALDIGNKEIAQTTLDAADEIHELRTQLAAKEKELQELRAKVSDAMYYSAQCARDCTVYDRECNFVETDEKALNKKLDDYYTKTFTNEKL